MRTRSPLRPGRPARRSAAFVLAALAASLVACTPVAETVDAETDGVPAPRESVEVAEVPHVQEIVTGLQAPWSVVFLADGTALVSERDSGDVLEILADGTTRVAGTLADVVHGGEGGLLGLAVADDALYAYSTGPDGNRIQRFEVTGAAGSYALGAADTVIDGIPAANTHNGGRLAFGPDGMLYATAGDAASGWDAQDPDSLAGKVLRLTPEGAVPDDNPFPGSPVYSLGHRNPQGLDWAEDGTLFVAEFGQNTWDELNVVVPGGNYGWPVVEGQAGSADYVDPVQQWRVADASPSGLEVVGDTIYVANLRGERLRSIPVSDPSTSTEALVAQYGRLRTVTLAPDGTLWIMTNNTDGRGTPLTGDDRIVSIPLGSL